MPFFFILILSILSPEPLLAKSELENYLEATNTNDEKKSCKIFTKLAQKPQFVLSDLAHIRRLSTCKSPLSEWSKLDQKIKHPVLRQTFVRAWYESLVEDKDFKLAYRLYKTNKDSIDLDKKDFEKLALGALKSQLTVKEKKTIQAELERRSPRFIRSPKKSDYLSLAHDFRDSRDFEKALNYYRKVINDPSFSLEKRWYGFKGARQTYKLERWSRMESYIKATEQWGRFLRDKYKQTQRLTKLHHDANIDLVRTLWTERGQDKASPILTQLEKELQGRYSLQQIYWLKGKMAEERGDYKQAVKDLKKASQEKSTNGREEERILWSLAWNQRRVKAYKDSLESLEKLKMRPDVTFFALSKYKYWQAENHLSLGETNKATQLFDELIAVDQFGYYGALAFRHLEQKFPPINSQRAQPEKVLSLLPKGEQSLFKALAQVRELDVAEKLVSHFVKTQANWQAQDWLVYLSLLQKAGAYKAFFQKYHSLKPEIQSALSGDSPHLLFPRPHLELVKKASQETQVSEALIYAIMKQESGFDIKARSPADAFGLLQLIPQVAQVVAKKAPHIHYQEPYDMFLPEVVIPLGAHNLRLLLQRFKNNFIMSVASYNASEKAVRGWIKSRFQGDPITFIEDIPYEETKGYVKLVMRNYIVYERLSEKSQLKTFPEHCLEGLDQF